MEFDGSLRSAFRIIAETRVDLERAEEAERLEELYAELGIARTTVRESLRRIEAKRAERARGLQGKLFGKDNE